MSHLQLAVSGKRALVCKARTARDLSRGDLAASA
jgi:hypothetical protein